MSAAVASLSKHRETIKPMRTAGVMCEAILSGVVGRSYAAKQDVFHEGDAKQYVFQVESGAVCLYRSTADGKRQIFDFAFPGDVIGLGASERYSCSAQAIMGTWLKPVPLSRLNQRAARDPSFALGLYRAVSSELEATRDLVLTLGHQNALERIAIFLMNLSRRNIRNGKDPHRLTLSMRRSDIGDLLGMTIETVSRCLSKLKQDGIIEIVQCSTVQIVDRQALSDLTGEVTSH